MTTQSFALLLAFFAAAPVASSQQPDTTARSDSVARADSLARQDSLVRRELARIRGEARPAPSTDSAHHADTSSVSTDVLSSLTIIADMIADLTPDGSTLESERRFELRDVHLALGAAIDSRLRGDFMVGVDDESRVMVMEAVLSTTSLPWGLQLRAGRFQVPFGKQNETHRVHLPTIDYPHVIQRFLGAHGGRGTGFAAGYISNWLGFRQELVLTALERFPEGHDAGSEHTSQGHVTFEPLSASPPNRTLQGLGYTGRLRTSWHVGLASSFEVSVNAGTGRSAQPFGCENFGHYEACPAGRGETAVNARQSLVGADLTFRWQPGSSNGARSLVVQSEFMRQQNAIPRLPLGAPPQATYLGPSEDPAGAYALARFQLSRRIYVGTRFDWVESIVQGERNTLASSAYLQLAPSDLSKLVLGLERVRRAVGGSVNRVLVQITIGIGPRRTHDH